MTMYNPSAFRENDLARQQQLIKEFPLGLLISSGIHGPHASPLPFHLEAAGSTLGVLRCHLARANEHWRTLDGANVLVVFQGHDAYVSPAWYASKTEHGKVVPTWNYAMVQARGVARVIEDPAWLHRQITMLTEAQEAKRATPWHVGDAPESFIEGQLRAIVGIEIEVQQIDGKWKVSQNRSAADRDGVVAGLEESGDVSMADMVRAGPGRKTSSGHS